MNNYIILTLILICLTAAVIMYRSVNYNQIINPSNNINYIPSETGPASSNGNLMHVKTNIDGPRKDYYV